MFKFIAIFSVIILFVACSSEPEVITVVVTVTPEPPTVTPTASPVPTATQTSIPTNTPVPTHTPTQTFTPVPTHTPTRTPIPTSTRVPTYTPRPTSTPVSDYISSWNCDDWLLQAQIVDLSQTQSSGIYRIEILKIYNAKEVRRTEDRLDCSGEAMLNISDGFNDLYDVIYHIEIDPDGDAFIGYEIQ